MRNPRLTIQHPETCQFDDQEVPKHRGRSEGDPEAGGKLVEYMDICHDNPCGSLDAPRFFFRESLVVRHLARRRARPRCEARAEELPPALFRRACFHEAWKRA